MQDDELLIECPYDERLIECRCGNWEIMCADEQRHHSQTFIHVRNVGDEAMYKCTCGGVVKSTCSTQTA